MVWFMPHWGLKHTLKKKEKHSHKTKAPVFVYFEPASPSNEHTPKCCHHTQSMITTNTKEPQSHKPMCVSIRDTPPPPTHTHTQSLTTERQCHTHTHTQPQMV